MERGLERVNHQGHLAEWIRRVEACRKSGQRVSEWCGEHGIPVSTYYTGMRLGELLGLKWSDIDFEKDQLHIGVSQKTLHDPDIYFCVNPSRGECMTQAVRGKTADTSLITDSPESAAHIGRVLRSAQLGAKYKIIILISLSSGGLVYLLLSKNICQQSHSRLVERDSPLTGWGFGRTEIQVPAILRVVWVFRFENGSLDIQETVNTYTHIQPDTPGAKWTCWQTW